MEFLEMWRELAPIGRSAATGGYFRQPFASAERECHAWFRAQAAARGLELETDPIGNTIAWWRPDGVSGPGVVTGSHLDSVRDGGAFDGPLGVVTAFAALDRLRETGVRPDRPIGVAVFVEEEGSRFGVACLGSRLATGSLDPTAARELRDPDGVWLGDALAEHGLEAAASTLLDDVAVFVELHVEQGRHLVDRDAAIGIASGIWPHGRYRFDFTGAANHVGSTRMEDRRDPMLTYAMTVLAANKQARLSGQRATFGRVQVEPGSTNAIAARVTGWLDARAESDEALAALVEAISRQGQDRATRDQTTLDVVAESVSAGVAFDGDLARRLAVPASRPSDDAPRPTWPVLASQAGHDAGVLAAAGVTTAMLFVRNPTGVSHAPEERIETADALTGVEALVETLTRLVTAAEAGSDE